MLDPQFTGIGTKAVHAAQSPDPSNGARALPIHQTTSFVFKNAEHAADLFALRDLGHIYTRLNNPTNDVLEGRLAALDGGVGGLAHSSGQAAITNAILNLCGSGDHVVSASQIYGGTYSLFRYTFAKLGIDVSFVNADDPDNFRKALKPNTKAIFGETLGNPRLNVFPVAEVAAIAREAGVPLILDNTVLTPAIHRPIEHGTNVVVYSTTKFLAGHGTSIGGMVVDGGNFNWGNGKFPGFTDPDPSYHGLVHWDAFRSFAPFGGANVAYIMKMRLQLLRDMGACPSPLNSWLTLQGVETLHVRMDRHCSNALKVAEFLASHDKVGWVTYPGLKDSPYHALAQRYMKGGFGALVGFGIKGGAEAGKRFIGGLRLFSHLANIGDAKSLAIHPGTTTHSQLTAEEQVASGVTEDFVRLSIGIEDIEDILKDLEFALAKA